MCVKERDNMKTDDIADLGFAKLDLGRAARTGFPEVVFCQGQPDEALVDIYRKLAEWKKAGK